MLSGMFSDRMVINIAIKAAKKQIYILPFYFIALLLVLCLSHYSHTRTGV